MKPQKTENTVKGVPQFLVKILEDKKAIQKAIRNGTSLAEVAKERGITFVQPL